MEARTDRLVLDIGNTRTKLGLFANGRLVRHAVSANGDLAAIRSIAASGQVGQIVVGSVTGEDRTFLDQLASLGNVVVITGTSPSHLRSAYTTPHTLGADRWANAVGASLMFPERAVLSVSLGTCMILDLVDASGTYQGGIIAPGFGMRARALNAFTARLPLIEPPAQPMRIGRSTAECLAAGVHHGLRAELSGTIAEIRQQHGDLAVVVTGGDAVRFARALENGIFAHPFLTLHGLHALSLFDRQAPPAPPAR